jgi:CCR4-NOT transcription complex subunit 1
VDLFKYMAPFLVARKYSDAIRLLYRGTLRVLLILLHDFPEFLCAYQFGFMDVLPLQCIQLRNLVLSAFPKVMKLPDPFSMNLAASAALPEMQLDPIVLSEFATCLGSLKADIDAHLERRGGPGFLAGLKGRLSVEKGQDGLNYNVGLINALVFYVGVYAVGRGITKEVADLFQSLASDLDTEGKRFDSNGRAILLFMCCCQSSTIPE